MYYVELCIPVNYSGDCQRGFYVFKTTNLAKAMRFADMESKNIVCPGAVFLVKSPQKDLTIYGEFKVK